MIRETLADGTTSYRYLEESREGRVIVTLIETGPNLYFAHRGWYNDKAAADDAFVTQVKQSETVDWLKTEKYGGEKIMEGPDAGKDRG